MTDRLPADADALCAAPYVDPEVFFRNDPAARRAAEELCRRCPLKDPCAAYAMSHSVDGYWAGTTFEERRAWRAKNGVVAKPIVDDGRPLWQQVMDMHADGEKGTHIADALGVTKWSVYSTISRYRDGRRVS